MTSPSAEDAERSRRLAGTAQAQKRPRVLLAVKQKKRPPHRRWGWREFARDGGRIQTRGARGKRCSAQAQFNLSEGLGKEGDGPFSVAFKSVAAK